MQAHRIAVATVMAVAAAAVLYAALTVVQGLQQVATALAGAP